MFGTCNLCGFIIVKIGKGVFGTRCARCFSTQIHRAVGVVIDELGIHEDAKVYELSSRGALFRYLKHRFLDLYYSEYFEGVPPGRVRNGIPCQDVQRLQMEDSVFDLVTSTEVFEHVPEDDKGFAEIFRVLREGGHFVFSVPLADMDRTLERAEIGNDGRIIYLQEPEYHWDWFKRKKVLAFRTYGRDILERLTRIGFARAEIKWVASRLRRIERIPIVLAKKEKSARTN